LEDLVGSELDPVINAALLSSKVPKQNTHGFMTVMGWLSSSARNHQSWSFLEVWTKRRVRKVLKTRAVLRVGAVKKSSESVNVLIFKVDASTEI